MLDHVGVPVSDYMRSKGFYLKVLAALGYDLVLEVASEETGGHSHAGFGAGAKPQFWIGSGKPVRGQGHFALTPKKPDAGRAFPPAPPDARRKDHRAPRPRPPYPPNHYPPL